MVELRETGGVLMLGIWSAKRAKEVGPRTARKDAKDTKERQCWIAEGMMGLRALKGFPATTISLVLVA
jgi:hypothetical protein